MCRLCLHTGGGPGVLDCGATGDLSLWTGTCKMRPCTVSVFKVFCGFHLKLRTNEQNCECRLQYYLSSCHPFYYSNFLTYFCISLYENNFERVFSTLDAFYPHFCKVEWNSVIFYINSVSLFRITHSIWLNFFATGSSQKCPIYTNCMSTSELFRLVSRDGMAPYSSFFLH